VILIGQHLIYPKMPRLLEVLFRMKKDQTQEMVTFSNKLDEAIYPIIKNDAYKVYRPLTRTSIGKST
jgi:hypothetical protein